MGVEATSLPGMNSILICIVLHQPLTLSGMDENPPRTPYYTKYQVRSDSITMNEKYVSLVLLMLSCLDFPGAFLRDSLGFIHSRL